MTHTISIVGKPFTMNDARSMTAWALRREVAHCRTQAVWAARAARIPRLERVAITVTHERPDRRSMPDIGACAFAVKAAIDGLVDARVIPDDTPQHLTRLTFLAPAVTGRHALTLIIETA